MNADDEFTSEVLAALACLPSEAQARELSTALSLSLKHISAHRLLDLRRRIAQELDEANPAVRLSVDLIEGQLALREIGGGAYWR